MGDYYYTGCFLDSASSKLIKTKRLGKALSNPNEILHMTVQFKPEPIDETLFGEKIRIKVVGYGIDKENEGFLVEAHSDNQDVQQLIDAIEIPHITMSIGANGKHRNTRNLQFEKIEPFSVSGIYGGFVQDTEQTGYLVLGSDNTKLVTSKDIDTDDAIGSK